VDLKAAADVQYVVKNGITYTLPQMLAPFKTPVALAMRKKAIYAYNKRCGQSPESCETGAHAD
jgi:hypothetical protein